MLLAKDEHGEIPGCAFDRCILVSDVVDNFSWNLCEIFRAQDRLIIALRFGQRLSKLQNLNG